MDRTLLSVQANEATKENHTKAIGGGPPTLTGKGGQAVAVDIVESETGLYGMPKLPTAIFGKLKDIAIQVDMTTDATVNAVVEMVVKIASAWKPQDADGLGACVGLSVRATDGVRPAAGEGEGRAAWMWAWWCCQPMLSLVVEAARSSSNNVECLRCPVRAASQIDLTLTTPEGNMIKIHSPKDVTKRKANFITTDPDPKDPTKKRTFPIQVARAHAIH